MHGGNRHRTVILTLLLLCIAHLGGYGQVTATLRAIDNLVQVGKPFEVELVTRHPEQTVVVFPDSAKDFAPYELQSSYPMDTKTSDGSSEDAKLYRLYTWEIDSLQSLRLPIRFIDAKGDTQTVLSNTVSVVLMPEVTAYSDSLEYKFIENLAAIREPVNWVAWGIIATTLLLIGFLIFIFGRKPIIRWWKYRKIERQFKSFEQQLLALQGRISDQIGFWGGLNKVWRAYFDTGRQHYFLARTTKELEEVLPLAGLEGEAKALLMEIAERHDRALYAGLPQDTSSAANYISRVHGIMIAERNRRKEAVKV